MAPARSLDDASRVKDEHDIRHRQLIEMIAQREMLCWAGFS
jgi:hypothetical protein